MLKMMCPNCHEQIISALLAEVDQVSCHHCQEGVPVHNVLISARGMTINRDDLLKRFFRYKKLLSEVVEERALMEDDSDVLATSKKNAEQFIETLEELMDGARDNFRLQFSLSVPVRCNFDNRIQSGWLVNLSMVGACIETENFYYLPDVGSVVSVEFSPPSRQDKFILDGMVAWVKTAGKGSGAAHDIGVKFIQLSEANKSKLWQLISASVHDAIDNATVN